MLRENSCKYISFTAARGSHATRHLGETAARSQGGAQWRILYKPEHRNQSYLRAKNGRSKLRDRCAGKVLNVRDSSSSQSGPSRPQLAILFSIETPQVLTDAAVPLVEGPKLSNTLACNDTSRTHRQEF
jgi:hypothetical protein